jgi:hypothetical protein
MTKHLKLILKLENTVLEWFESYLSNRRQQVVINGETTDTKYINAGVP